MKRGQVSIGVIAGGAITVTLGLFGFLFTQVSQSNAKADSAVQQTATISNTFEKQNAKIDVIDERTKWLTAVISKQYGIPMPDVSTTTTK